MTGKDEGRSDLDARLDEASQQVDSLRTASEADLVDRLDRANKEIDRLHKQLDSSGNVVRFRVTRYLESLDESAADLNARSRPMPPADTYERRKLGRDLGSLEDLIAVTDAEFASATAEEQGDARQEMRAEIRLRDVKAEADKRWWRRMLRLGRELSARPAPEREIEPGSTDEGR
jgi:hypothetical protein